MTYVLGIDTGGTYTDGVILERETKKIIAATKARTTHHDLAVSIGNVIAAFADEELCKIDYLALSTTLATNAVVENKGCRVGLLLLGSELDDLPPCLAREIGGKIDLSGIEREPLDLAAVERAAAEMKGKVDTIAISGMFSVRNPLHEEQAKQRISELLNLPVVTAHELTGTLGVKERTNTAVLNARLLAVIARLIKAVKQVMAEKNLDIPLMIVKGDGSLMTESVAMERPIETILSGPAASIIGATYLQDVKNGLVVDIGGTTTDIALLVNGKPSLTEEGAEVGGWRTRVSAVNAFTYGFGGDSYFHRDLNTGKWEVGPMRSWPVSVIAEQFPYYKTELVKSGDKGCGLYRFGCCDGLILLNQPEAEMELSPLQQKITEALQDGPHAVITIGNTVGMEPDFFRIDELITYGIVGLVGFTPTDVLCAAGELQQGDTEAAALARKRIAQQLGVTEEQLDGMCRAAVAEKLNCDLLSCVLKYNGYDFEQGNILADYYFRNAMSKTPNDLFDVAFRIRMPVIGIGAPVAAWLPQSAANFATETLITGYYQVTNAIGAAAGNVMTIFRLNLQNKNDEYLVLFAPWGREEYHRPEPADDEELIPYSDFIEATVAEVIASAEARLKQGMKKQGISDYQILTERKDKATGGKNNDNVKLFIESKIELAAVGAPVWLKQ